LYGLTLQDLKDPRNAIGRPSTVSWTTANRSFNFNDLFGALAKDVRINNEDPTNPVRYRLNGTRNTVRIDALGRDPIDNTWIEQVDIIPNGVTGLGTMQINLVTMFNALRNPNPDMLQAI